MCNPVQSIVDAIVVKIVGKVFQSVGHHVGFLFHYKQKLKNLEDEMNNLQGQRTNVEGRVNQAKHRGEVVDDNVLVWLKDVEETSQGVGTFMDDKKETMKCFNFSCPDFISRYCLSQQVEKKVVRVKHLTTEGGKISKVSHPKEDSPELELPTIGHYEDFQSRQKVFKAIVEALKDSKVTMIGVDGTGGVGKTTMVAKVAKLLKEDKTFDEVVMAVVSKDANVRKIQGQLADSLLLTLSGETEVGRAKELWKRLDNGKNNLIILDDVWHKLDMKEIGIFSNLTTS